MRTPPLSVSSLVGRRGSSCVAACGDDGPAAGTPDRTDDRRPSTTATTGRRPTRRSPSTATHRRPPSAPTTTRRSGHRARRSHVPVDGVEGYELVDGTQVELTFDGQDLGATAGCNQLASGWSLEGDVLVVPAMAMTQMACTAGGADGPGHVAVGGAHVAPDGRPRRRHADAHRRRSRRDARGPRGRQPRPPAGGHDVERRGADLRRRRVIAASRRPGADAGAGGRLGRARHRLQPRDRRLRARRRRPSRSGRSPPTRAACTDPAATEAEQIVLATLTGTATYEIEADVLTLRSGTNGLVLRGAGDSDAAAAIEGVTWTLDSIVETHGTSANTVTAVPALDQPATLTFDAGTVTVGTGCNTGSGGYQVAGDEITFGPIAITLMACPEPAGVGRAVGARRARRHGHAHDRRRRAHADERRSRPDVRHRLLRDEAEFGRRQIPVRSPAMATDLLAPAPTVTTTSPCLHCSPPLTPAAVFAPRPRLLVALAVGPARPRRCGVGQQRRAPPDVGRADPAVRRGRPDVVGHRRRPADLVPRVDHGRARARRRARRGGMAALSGRRRRRADRHARPGHCSSSR